MSKIKAFLRNLSYAFMANILSMVISITLLLLLPKFVSVSDFGYFQLYLFYVTYMAYMSFGLTDGVYLRYGGYKYGDIPKRNLISQFWFLVILDTIIYVIIIFCFAIFSDINKVVIIIFSCLAALFMVPRSLISFILQATNKIKDYSIMVILERIIYFILVITFIFIEQTNFFFLILADLLSKVLSSLYIFIRFKELVFGRLNKISEISREVALNISIGSKLLLANLSGILIIGVVRLSIEIKWSIETFGKIALTLNITNLLLSFINSIALVLFPALKRTSLEKLSSIYKSLRLALIIPLLGILLLYFPLQYILLKWIPQYSDSINYLSIIFPMCIFESKTLMLINTYLKALREEKMMLKINLLTLLFSIIYTYIFVFVIGSLEYTLLGIIIVFAIRSIALELYLLKIIKVGPIRSDLIMEVIITFCFIVVSSLLESFYAFLIYLSVYLIYLLIKKKEIGIILEVLGINTDKLKVGQ